MLLKCSYPDCDHIAVHITKVHCRSVHSMESDMLFKKYGKPKRITWRKGQGINHESNRT